MTDAAAREQNSTETDAAGHGLRVPFSEDETRRAAGGETPTPTPTPAARGRLTRLVAAKLALDLVFVGAFALYTYSTFHSGGFEGALEHADGRGARGWVVDLERPGEAVEVQLFENGRFVASAVADGPTGESDGAGRRGFAFNFERELYGEHEVRVYAVRAARGGTRRTLQQVGAPRGFIWK